MIAWPRPSGAARRRAAPRRAAPRRELARVGQIPSHRP